MRSRVYSDIEMNNLSAMMRQDHQNIQHPKSYGWHDYEID